LDEIVKIKIEHEISRIEKLFNDVKPLLDLCKIKEPDIIEMTASAQVLHSFYNGVESIIVLFFKYKNEKIPNDIKWHKTIFEMAFGNNSKNIKILDEAIKRNWNNIYCLDILYDTHIVLNWIGMKWDH
jgi:hypothetical protein